ncbi:MAG: P-II family nitrogen regulator [Nitrospirae bacterium]|nr:MAG: P-II family nitrogen regulator [Nitrospirota bacterium]
MKKIEAIIRPTKVGKVCLTLEKAGYPGLKFTQVENQGMLEGAGYQLRGKTYSVDLAFRAKVEVIVKDTEADRIVSAIRDAAFTGEIGDGEICVHEMEHVISVRTGESVEFAI